ncbi:MAG: hypothetical protein JSV03_04350 [Planctomycetota bacterium]|nr:MAG: hypothetical protein JSV03_04350 [Planctomycetota bacterium]
MKFVKTVIIISTFVVLCVSDSLGSEAYFKGLGNLSGDIVNPPPFGGTLLGWSRVGAVSADGNVVVGTSSYESCGFRCCYQAFRWTETEGMVGLGFLPLHDRQSEAFSVSADGSVVVGYSTNETFLHSGSIKKAYRWTEQTGTMNFMSWPPPFMGNTSSEANDVSHDGTIAVGYSSNNMLGADKACYWTEAGAKYIIGSDIYFQSYAKATSADGSVIVGQLYVWLVVGGPTPLAFRWTEEDGIVGLGILSGGYRKLSEAEAVSSDGTVIVGYSISASGDEAFRWTEEDGMVGLGDLEGGIFRSRALAVSADGSIILGSGVSDSGTEAFIWDSTNGMRKLRDVLINDYNLDLSGWRIVSVNGISDDGLTIVGNGISPDDHGEAWIAHIPGSVILPLDIKPGGCPNPLNRNVENKARLPMAILGTELLDVSEIEVDSISIAGTVFPVKSPSIEDVGTPFDGEECECHELEGDDIDDLVLHFSKREVMLALGLNEMEPGAIVPITVEGSLQNGISLTATDCVKLV